MVCQEGAGGLQIFSLNFRDGFVAQGEKPAACHGKPAGFLAAYSVTG
jgi:hypothetical protein